MARFQREAQVLASLNHPNIAAIYGLEEAGGVGAPVMELVERTNLGRPHLKGGRQGDLRGDQRLPMVYPAVNQLRRRCYWGD